MSSPPTEFFLDSLEKELLANYKSQICGGFVNDLRCSEGVAIVHQRMNESKEQFIAYFGKSLK